MILVDAAFANDAPIDIEDVPLAELLQTETAGRSEGAFGYRLRSYGVEPYLHGFAVVDFTAEQAGIPTFDLHYFNLFVGAEIREVVIPEIQLEYEHGGDLIEVRYAQIDVRTPTDLLTFRVGKFLVPFGLYNVQLYPEFISKLPDRPFVLREVVPVSWSDTGLMVRGGADVGEKASFGYKIYVANGLLQTPEEGAPANDVPEGGSIRDMRGNNRDLIHGAKAGGWRLGIETDVGLSIGQSGYVGAYTTDGRQLLVLVGLDLGFTRGPITLQAEAARAVQEVAAGDALQKWGANVLFAIQARPWIEPVLQVDAVQLDGEPDQDRYRATLGTNVRPWPELAENLVLKGSFAETVDGAGDTSWRTVAQLAVGF